MRHLLPLLVFLAFPLAGCAVPTDPDGTLDRVQGGILRVGITPHEPWTELRGERGGLEVELVEGFARSLGARVDWREGAEAELVEDLEMGQLDLVVGGLTARSPWKRNAALTRPYVITAGQHRAREKHVMAAALGENAFLAELERYLLDRERATEQRLAELEAAP